MNKEWSELNKTMQAQIKKKDTYKMGIDTLFNLRRQLMQTLVSFKEDLCREDFNAIPFINADGYHSKTIAYSIWHIFRIEDIVAHTVILISSTISRQDRGRKSLYPVTFFTFSIILPLLLQLLSLWNPGSARPPPVPLPFRRPA